MTPIQFVSITMVETNKKPLDPNDLYAVQIRALRMVSHLLKILAVNFCVQIALDRHLSDLCRVKSPDLVAEFFW